MSKTIAANNNKKKEEEQKKQQASANNSAPKATPNTTQPKVETKQTSTNIVKPGVQKYDSLTNHNRVQELKTEIKGPSTKTTQTKSTINPNSPSGIKAMYGVEPQGKKSAPLADKQTYDTIPTLEPIGKNSVQNLYGISGTLPTAPLNNNLANDIVEQYESLPTYNVFQRMFDKDKQNSYSKKQALSSPYFNIKNEEKRQNFYKAGLTDDDIRWLVDNPDPYEYDAVSGERLNPGAYPEYDRRKKEISAKIEAGGGNIAYSEAFGNNEYAREKSKKENQDAKLLASMNRTLIKPFEDTTNTLVSKYEYLSGKPISFKASEAEQIQQDVSEDLSPVGSWIYNNVAMPASDVAMSLALGQLFTGGSSVPKFKEVNGKTKRVASSANKISSATMAMEKAAGSINDALSRGLTPKQTAIESAAGAITTYLTELAPLEMLTDFLKTPARATTFAGWLGNKLKGFVKVGVPEGLQEVFENVSDMIVDNIIAGDRSKIKLKIKKFIDDGYSEEQATKLAYQDFAKETAIEGISGFLSSGVLSLGGGNFGGDSDYANILNQQGSTLGIPTLQQEVNTKPTIDRNVQPETVQANTDIEEMLPEIEKAVEEIDNKQNETVPTEQAEIPNLDTVYDNALTAIEQNAENADEIVNDAIDTLVLNDRFEDAEALEQLYNEFVANNENVDTTNEQIPTVNNVNNNATVNDIVNNVANNVAENGSETLPNIAEETASIKNERPDSGKYKTSEYVKNTIMNSPTFQQNENFIKAIEQGIENKEFEVDTQTWKWQNEQAAENLANDYEGTVKKIEESPDISAVQIKEGHMIADDLIQKDSETGDFSKTKKWIRLLADKVHGLGQGLNALAEFQRTASSALIKTEKMSDIKANGVKKSVKSEATNIAKNMRKSANVFSKASENLSNFVAKLNLQLFGGTSEETNTQKEKVKGKGNSRLSGIINKIGVKENTVKTEKSYNEIKEEVITTLKKKLPDTYEKMSDKDVDLLTTFIADKTGGVSNKVIQDEIEHLIEHGTFYDLYENVDEHQGKSSARLNSILESMGNKESTKKAPVQKTFEEVRKEVVNSLASEYGEMFSDMSDTGIDFITTLLMDKSIKREVIADELEHWLEHGTFYTIDESTAVAKPKNAKLNSVLNTLWKDASTMREATKEKSFATVKEEAINTLSDEYGSVFGDMSDSDLDYLTMLLMDKEVSRDTLAQELNYYAENGSFYTIDESIEEKQKSNSKLDSLIQKMTDDGTMVKEPVKKSFDEVRAEVAKSIENEDSKLFKNITDDKIDFLTNMIMQGESTEHITNAILKDFTTGYMEVSDEDIAKVNEIYEAINNHPNPDSKEVVELENEAFEILAKYLGPGTFAEKATQWRFLAMLFSPTTQGRNFSSNNVFGGIIQNMKDIIASGIETAVGVDEPTKAVVFKTLNKSDNDLYNKGFKDFETSVYRQAQGSKYSMEKGIYAHRKIYNDKGLGKAINKGIKFNKNLLEKSDVKSMQYRYARALAGYLKANGYDADIFSSRNVDEIELLDRARAYALNEAKIATYHEENVPGKLLSRWSREAAESDTLGGNALHLAIESSMPFKSTPFNIAKQGLVEYNPINIVNALIQTGQYEYNKAKGTQENLNYKPTDIIANFAKGATGSAVMYLGWVLASMGLIRAGSDDESDKFAGMKRYSLVLPNGGTYTLDWLAPAIIPLFLGVELYEAKKGDGDALDALSGVSDIMLEMTFLQGINNTIKSMGYAKDSTEKMANLAINTAGNYLSQYIPTIGGKLARSIDPYQRNTYVTGERSGSAKEAAKKSAFNMMNKIPGLSMLNQKSYDQLGEAKKNVGDNFLERFLYQNLSLGNYSAPLDEEDTVRQELYRLQKESEKSDSDDIPSVIPDYFPKTYDKTPLKPKEYAELQKEYGQNVKNTLDSLYSMPEYQELSESKKAEVTNKLININLAFEKEKLGYNIKNSTTYSKYWNEYQRTGDMQDVIDMVVNDSVYDGIAKDNNLSKNTNLFKEDIKGQELTQEEVSKIVGITPEETRASQEKIAEEIPTLDMDKIVSKQGWVDKQTAVPYLTDELGLSPAERGEILYNNGTRGKKEIEAFNAYGYDGVAEYYDANYYGDYDYGNQNNSLAKKEAIAYLEAQGYDAATINEWLRILGGGNWKADYNG